jgi:putative oxidoreductase
MSERSSSDPKLLFSVLGGFYNAVSDLWYPMLRIVAGAPLYAHAWPKFQAGPTAAAASMAKLGFVPGIFFAYAAMFLETVGATCVIVGLFTRFFAPALAIEMALICFVVMLPQGYSRMEPVLIWGILFFAIALRGGGPYSLDRVIGKEL